MDKLKKIRTPIRASITKTLIAINAELQKDEPNLDELGNSKEKLLELKPQVSALDNKIVEALVDAAGTDSDISVES